MNFDLNPAKSWFANNRSAAASAIKYANLVNTAAYMTNTISEETYAISLLSGMVGRTVFELIDASVCYAAKDTPCITDFEAEQNAKQKIEALKAEAAFREHGDWDLFLQTRFGFPGKENLKSMSAWQIAKGFSSFLTNSAAPLYASIKQGVYFRASEWSFIIPCLCATIVKETLKNLVESEEQSRDIETLNRWLSDLQELSSGPELLAVHQEIEEKFASTLNRVAARNPEIGLQYGAAFQTLVQAQNQAE